MKSSQFIAELQLFLRKRLDSQRWSVGGERGKGSTLRVRHIPAKEVICENKFEPQLWVNPQQKTIRCTFEIEGSPNEQSQREKIANDIREAAIDIFSIDGILLSEGSTVGRLELTTNDHADQVHVDPNDLRLVLAFCEGLDAALMGLIKGRQHRELDAPYFDGPSVTSSPRQKDPMLRCQIEKAAVSETICRFEEKGYRVHSQEKDNVGWDLVATMGDEQLLLEVKGLSGRALCVELTPNEYEQMRVRQDCYRVCVVTTALTKPQLAVFSYRSESRTWRDDQERTLRIKELIAARCHVK